MMMIMLVFQLFLGVVTLNSLYSINYADFHNACEALDATIVYSSLATPEILDLEVLGINEANFEDLVMDFMVHNVHQSKVKVAYYFYNHDGSTCSSNQCDSVQLKLSSVHQIFKLKQEYNYRLIINL
ncbi:MAG: hypothetical protein PHY11_02490 [Bacilli bacterium]|nr:hypothetical protein [Bacilli bacterium]MDD3422182.1 hypothetical protein [Bacilli bacterium]MDD4065851.1 hypothetical protein [Bacilli bacterium]